MIYYQLFESQIRKSPQNELFGSVYLRIVVFVDWHEGDMLTDFLFYLREA